MSEQKEIKVAVFLYTRLADYFYQSIQFWLRNNLNYEAIIIRYAPDKNAPFVFESNNRLELINKDAFASKDEIQAFVDKKAPVILYTAGWSDIDYIKIAKYFYGRIPTIVGLDNPWEGTIKQKIGVLGFSRRLKKIYSHIWVAGKPQYEFARRLGFKHSEVLSDLYSANTPIFENAYLTSREDKKCHYPKKLFYIGRYVDYKQPLLLVKLFRKLEEAQNTNGWTLELVGVGTLSDELKKYESETIKINGFIVPSQLPEKLSKSGAFCLPSKSEHWGVVVHEAVATGLPVILSDTTYAGTEFLI
jgi:glycosyltransferase involved in cell wall biosynthesis